MVARREAEGAGSTPAKAKALGPGVEVQLLARHSLLNPMSGARPSRTRAGSIWVRRSVDWSMTRRPTPPESATLHSDPDILGGVPVFVGTRVPVSALLDYLAAGQTLAAFLDDYPTVSQAQAQAALDLAREALTAGATPT